MTGRGQRCETKVVRRSSGQQERRGEEGGRWREVVVDVVLVLGDIAIAGRSIWPPIGT